LAALLSTPEVSLKNEILGNVTKLYTGYPAAGKAVDLLDYLARNLDCTFYGLARLSRMRTIFRVFWGDISCEKKKKSQKTTRYQNQVQHQYAGRGEVWDWSEVLLEEGAQKCLSLCT